MRRNAIVALALLALALKLQLPEGYMPGSSLAQPIVLCPDQAPMPAMAMAGMSHDGQHVPGKVPHGSGDHSCPFAASAATPLAPQLASTDLPRPALSIAPAARGSVALAPGRGLAAPPPPSHAPPFRGA